MLPDPPVGDSTSSLTSVSILVAKALKATVNDVAITPNNVRTKIIPSTCPFNSDITFLLSLVVISDDGVSFYRNAHHLRPDDNWLIIFRNLISHHITKSWRAIGDAGEFNVIRFLD